MFWLLSFVSSATQGGLASVKVTTLAGGAGDDSCRLAGHRDGLASLALFNLPARVQAVKKRLYVLDNHNGCIRSFPLGQPPADTYVRSDTGCGSNSTLAYLGPDARFPNGTSRGWPWVDGPLDFWVSNDTAKIWVVDTYNNKLKVATLAPSGGGVAVYGPWEDLAGSGEIGFQDGDAATASFYQPHGLAVAESAGYAYVSDTFASCIRSISLRTGAVKTIAGTCGQGGHRDFPGSTGGRAAPGSSGSALDARFNHVHKVTLDPRNESLLYVSDVECSDDGPLYIEERCRKTYNNTIFTGVRRLEISSKDGGCTSVSTVAGYFDPSNPTGDQPLGFADGPILTAKFHYIHGVAFQPLSEAEKATLQHGGHGSGGSTAMYACDDDNFAIRKIDFVAKNVTTLAGTGAQGCADGNGAHATLGAVGLGLGEDGTIYVADYLNHRIRQLSIGGEPPSPPSSPSPG